MSSTDKMTTNKKTITFTRTTEREVSFAEWYDEVKEKYPVKADAKKVWAEMCYVANTSDQYQYREIDNCDDLEWFEFEDKLEELEDDAKEQIKARGDEVSDKKPEASEAVKPDEA